MSTPDGPADTRMMGIVHDALKRDLLRARECCSPRRLRAAGSAWPWAST